jgi:hypothetical protein
MEYAFTWLNAAEAQLTPQVLFNRPEWAIGKPEVTLLMGVLLNQDQEVLCFQPIHLVDKKAYSPYRGSCSLPEGSEANNPLLLAQLWQNMLVGLRAMDCHSWTYQAAAEFYHAEQVAALHLSLLKSGFKPLARELNHHLVLEEDNQGKWHESEKRRLRKCEAAGFTLIKKDSWGDEHFPFIEAARIRKGHPMTMQANQLAKLNRNCSEAYTLFELWDGAILVALAFGIRITKDIAYYFLPADNGDYQQYSPMVMVVDAMMQHYKEVGVTLFDLGVSSDNEVPNPGLCRFKEHLGGLPSAKWKYVYTF